MLRRFTRPQLIARSLSLLACTFAIAAIGAGGCSADGSPNTVNHAGGNGASGGGGNNEDSGVCLSCVEGKFFPCGESTAEPEDCEAQGLVCVSDLGCRACEPGKKTCVGNEVRNCTADGSAGDEVSEVCDVADGLICNGGRCTTECEKVAGSPSNVGCEFWAVDLPNERIIPPAIVKPNGLSARDEPWGVILANAGTTAAHVTIERNLAQFGQSHNIVTVFTGVIPVGGVEPIQLPNSEVNGPIGADPPGPPGSQMTSNGYRITSTAPLVAYQFNPFLNTYSNDASLLLPREGLGTLHRVLGFRPSKPVAIGGFNIAGIPERAFVTIVGVEPNTTVRVKAGNRINTDGKYIPRLEKDDEHTFEFTIGPFDVLNLGSEAKANDPQYTMGDLTGTVVESSRPVAVFSSTETSQLSRPNMPPEGESCCTDHLEEQIFPVTALGKQFVITRSPLRGTSDIEEDFVRFLGIAEPTEITTNLPGGDAQFTLQPGEVRDIWTKVDFVASATAPVAIGQILVSQQTTEQSTGDPSLTIFPPVEQYRQDYAFLIPKSWPKNYVVISTTADNQLTMDGNPLTGCVTAPAGTVEGVDYIAMRCPIAQDINQYGVYRLRGTQPFGITVYGYSGPASFAFAGGADVKPVYEPPKIF